MLLLILINNLIAQSKDEVFQCEFLEGIPHPHKEIRIYTSPDLIIEKHPSFQFSLGDDFAYMPLNFFYDEEKKLNSWPIGITVGVLEKIKLVFSVKRAKNNFYETAKIYFRLKDGKYVMKVDWSKQ